MGKRKREKDETTIINKIRKLEQKLQRRRRIISSDDSDSNYVEEVANDEMRHGSPTSSSTRSKTPPASLGVSQLYPNALDMPDLISPLEESPISTSDKADIDVVTDLTENTQLEDDILQILGEAPQPDTKLGKNIHADIASRWQDILIRGLPKEAKETILKKYFIPENCSFLLAPILNPEAKAAVTDILVKRDATLLQKQNQIGIALTALAELTDMVLKNENSKQKLLQPLSDACRLLCDSHNLETKTRRSIIMSSINTNLRDTLDTTKRDKFLFGEDLPEKLKAAKSVQKTGESLSRINPVASSSKSFNFRNAPKNRNLNYRGPVQRKPPIRINEVPRGRPTARQTHQNPASRRLPPPPPRKIPSPTRRNYRR